MPSWNELLETFAEQVDDEARFEWLNSCLAGVLDEVGSLRGGRNVIMYGSSFLQRPRLPAESIMITPEDLNGFMACIHGMEPSNGLTLILHTPGGSPNAAEMIVSYLRSKFTRMEVIVPALAMSAGTMISLGADQVVMGRQSQLGPIDPQLVFGGGQSVSAQAVVDQFEQAKGDVLSDPTMAHVWAPILPALGPSLLVEAENALSYSESMVSKWIERWMLVGHPDAEGRAAEAARYFNDAKAHKSHGRRIDRVEAREQGLRVEDLETSQELQEAVLTAYHLMTIFFEQGPVTKMIRANGTERSWVKIRE